MDDRDGAFLRETLSRCGASGDVLDALLTYTANPFHTGLGVDRLPLADAPHVEAWQDYARKSKRGGVWRVLVQRLVQLQFPVSAGISQTDSYRAATRRGAPSAGGPGLAMDDPGGLDLTLHSTLAGRVPVITCSTRGDFVSLVQALSCRNEPASVPDSMGACIVAGLNNWDRVRRLRRRLEDERGAPFDDDGWREAFAQVIPRKPDYQDRVILLSSEPYSAVPAAALGLDDAEWRKQSVAIRREHECTHYFTLVAFGVMRNNLFDELIADFAGLARTYGRYDASLALRFLGLEAHPQYRAGGRFENYLQTPPIPPEAAPILRDVVVRAARAVEAFTRDLDLAAPPVRDSIVLALTRSTLVELASDTAAARLRERLAAVQPLLDASESSG